MAKSIRIIRNVYLYLVALIGLVTFVFGSIGIINNVLQNYVFQVDDYYYEVYPVRGDMCTQSYPDPTDEAGKTMIAPTEEEITVCREQTELQREKNRESNVGREFSISIAQILVGLPIWLFHWAIIMREYRKKREDE